MKVRYIFQNNHYYRAALRNTSHFQIQKTALETMQWWFRRRQIVLFPMTDCRRQFSPRNLSAFVTPSKIKINPCGCAVADTAARRRKTSKLNVCLVFGKKPDSKFHSGSKIDKSYRCETLKSRHQCATPVSSNAMIMKRFLFCH